MVEIINKLKDACSYAENQMSIFDQKTEHKDIELHTDGFPVITGEFWTSRQRQGSSIHEVSYRACFKPQLPNFFINLFTETDDVVYDPFSGRGTTAIEAALTGRNVIVNDVNPLSKILTLPRLKIPTIKEVEQRLADIPLDWEKQANIDLSMFYHKNTEAEVVSIREYLQERKSNGKEDYVDDWIRMVATNKLSGHSKHFFSVYTLPPNQACMPEKQKEINRKYKQIPEYKNTKEIILKKTNELQKDISCEIRKRMFEIGTKAVFLNNDASSTYEIPDSSVCLVVTSPPFLDVVDYAKDNWLRCWFNDIDIANVQKNITVMNKLENWEEHMRKVFFELFRVVKSDGYVAFEVGEIRNGKVQLEQSIVPIGMQSGFKVIAVVINKQEFTKTSNIWGVSNNAKGTNTNRIVILRKP